MGAAILAVIGSALGLASSISQNNSANAQAEMIEQQGTQAYMQNYFGIKSNEAITEQQKQNRVIVSIAAVFICLMIVIVILEKKKK